MPLPDWMLDGSKFGEYGLELEYDYIATRIINLHHVCRRFRHESSCYNLQQQIIQAHELNREAQYLDEELQKWAARFSRICTYQEHILDEPVPQPREHLYSSKVYIYPSAGYGGAWSDYFGTAMLITATRLRLLESTANHFRQPSSSSSSSPSSSPSTINSTPQDQQLHKLHQQHTHRMQTLSEAIAATIPYCLGLLIETTTTTTTGPSPTSSTTTKITLHPQNLIMPYLGSLLVWSLAIASSLMDVGMCPKQQTWFRKELASLGRLTGEAVLEAAETGSWGIL